jgi:hypothetical protein
MNETQDLAIACAPKNIEQLWKFSDMASKTALIPRPFQGKPSDTYIAISMGLELGLKPLQALSGIAVVNGKPCLYGDSLMALCRNNETCEYIVETFDRDSMTATCKAKRKGQPEQVTEFSKEDAVTAGLWNKQGPWKQYPKRMLQMRARGFCLRDTFPDALMGLITREEAEDYPTKDIEVKVSDAPEPKQDAPKEAKVEKKASPRKATNEMIAGFWQNAQESGIAEFVTDDERQEIVEGMLKTRLNAIYKALESRAKAYGEAQENIEPKDQPVEAEVVDSADEMMGDRPE